jgi:hypothetical protein
MFKRSSTVKMGDKSVTIPKLTPAKYKRIFGEIQALPSIILNILAAPKEDLQATIIAAVESSIDEFVKLVAVVAELDPKYVEEKVGVNEIVEFIVKTVQANDIVESIKKLKGVIATVTGKESEEV